MRLLTHEQLREQMTRADMAESVTIPADDFRDLCLQAMSGDVEVLNALKRLSDQCDRLRLPGQQATDAEKTARETICRVSGGN